MAATIVYSGKSSSKREKKSVFGNGEDADEDIIRSEPSEEFEQLPIKKE
jgi:hypothetical protein